MQYFRNLASSNLSLEKTILLNEKLQQELLLAKIPIALANERLSHLEVPSGVFGTLHNWTFIRYWTYWVCNGPGLELESAIKLHKKFGEQVRVDGHCGCPSPEEWFENKAINHYHIDTQEGLNAFAALLYRDYGEIRTVPCHY